MKRKDVSAMHAMKPAELAKRIQEQKKKLAEYLVNRYSKQSKNVREGRAMKRTIAVLSSVLRLKELSHE